MTKVKVAFETWSKTPPLNAISEISDIFISNDVLAANFEHFSSSGLNGIRWDKMKS